MKISKRAALLAILTLLVTLLVGCSSPSAENANNANVNEEQTNAAAQTPQTVSGAPDNQAAEEPAQKEAKTNDQITVGIAWRADQQDSGYEALAYIYRNLGCKVVLMDPVQYDDFEYNADGTLSAAYEGNSGMLALDYAQQLKDDPLKSNAAELMEGIDMVIFTGGEEISPTLYAIPKTYTSGEEDCNATRDVSDYTLMAYCLAHDIPQLDVCRGMQMLGVVSGDQILPDIKTYYEQQGVSYPNTHRVLPGTPDPDFVAHDVVIDDQSSIFAELAGGISVWEDAPAWHHQAIEALTEGDNLIATASTTANGISIIEAVERTDQTFAVGIQFHPEASIRMQYTGSSTVDNYSSPEQSWEFFQRVLDKAFG